MRPSARAAFADLFAAERLAVDAADPGALVLFPEMEPAADVPEITEACWGILHQSPDRDDVRHQPHGRAPARGRPRRSSSPAP